MRIILPIAASFLLLCSCNSNKESNGKNQPQTTVNSSDFQKSIEATIDSISKFKPVKLTINDAHSDVDELIPVGINTHGSFAFLLLENSGGASGFQYNILPAYHEFSVNAKFDMDEELDTTLLKNKEMIYYSLKSAGIKLQNSIRKISPDSLQKQYGFKFDVSKTYGLADSNDASGNKTIASILIKYQQGNMFPAEIVNKNFSPSHGVYNVYISDYLVVPGEEGLFGFVVLVIEGAGFEGYVRKSIEVIPIGALNSN